MTASELRLGNLVKVGKNALHSDGGSKEIYEISELKKDVVHFKGFHAGEFYKDIEPIPLTEEWLLKFGFEDVTGVYYTLHISPDFKLLLIPADGFYPQLDKADENNWQSVSLNKIEHVHELQNLYFALTGEELETKQDTTPTQRAALDENFDQTQTTQYCICDFVMVERNPNTDEARCFTCKKQIKE